MRILMVVQSCFPFQDRGGPVVKVRALARGLARRQHQVTVVTADLGFSARNGYGMNVARWGWRALEDDFRTLWISHNLSDIPHISSAFPI